MHGLNRLKSETRLSVHFDTHYISILVICIYIYGYIYIYIWILILLVASTDIFIYTHRIEKLVIC